MLLLPNFFICIFCYDAQTIVAGEMICKGVLRLSNHCPCNLKQKRCIKMSKSVVPEAQEALNRFKMEAANEVGVNLNQGYNGHLTSKEAGSVGGQMVKKMIKAYEESMR